MEVHHHAHTSRKKWTHYFWEFLMLFLAVFCGFMAENQREHMIEHKREKQFVKSLINDLRLDIAWLDTVTNSAKSRIQNIDSIISIMTTIGRDEIPASGYQYIRRAAVQIMFFPHDGTITQLKSSGAMRLIRNRAAVDSIENYNRLLRRLEVRRDITNELTHDFTAVANKTITGKDLLRAVYDSVFFGVQNTGQSIKLNDAYINELINQSISMRLRAVTDTNAYLLTKTTAINMIDFLRKEYHLSEGTPLEK